LNFNKSFLELGFLVLSFLFAGYSLISLLRPEENYHELLNKPLLILEFSVLIILAVSVILKFSLGLHVLILVTVMSIITMVLSLSAYIRRIGYYKPNGKRIVSHSPDETPIQPEKASTPTYEKTRRTVAKPTTKPSPKSKFSLFYDLILIDLVSIFILSTYFIHHISINLLHDVIGIIYMVFIPGYMFMAILLPKKSSLETIIRLGLSIGITLPVTSLIGMVLYYTEYGISINSLLIPLAILTLILSVYAIKRRINAYNQ
jgi:uncharacterized membrane protein